MEDIYLENKTSLGLLENVESTLCYVLGFVTGIIFYILEKDNKTVKFHAIQSIYLFLPLFIIGNVFSTMIYYIGYGAVLIGTLVWIAELILWIVLIAKTYQGEMYKLPIVGDIAAKQAGI